MPGAPRGRPTYDIITHPTNEGLLVRWQLIELITISRDGVFASVCSDQRVECNLPLVQNTGSDSVSLQSSYNGIFR